MKDGMNYATGFRCIYYTLCGALDSVVFVDMFSSAVLFVAMEAKDIMGMLVAERSRMLDQPSIT